MPLLQYCAKDLIPLPHPVSLLSSLSVPPFSSFRSDKTRSNPCKYGNNYFFCTIFLFICTYFERIICKMQEFCTINIFVYDKNSFVHSVSQNENLCFTTEHFNILYFKLQEVFYKFLTSLKNFKYFCKIT